MSLHTTTHILNDAIAGYDLAIGDGTQDLGNASGRVQEIVSGMRLPNAASCVKVWGNTQYGTAGSPTGSGNPQSEPVFRG